MKPESEQEIVIIGAGEFAEIAYEYFTFDSPYTVRGFSVERSYLSATSLFDLPVVPFEELEKTFDPARYKVFVALTYTQLNRARERLYNQVKAKGFACVSYVSSKAFVWRNVQIGENSFIFENNVLQHHCRIGNNVILWSGNHIGHRTVIRDHAWITSHAVISGFCEIGESSFLGVNSTLNDQIAIAKDTVVGSGAVVIKPITEPGQVWVGNPAKALVGRDSYETFKVSPEER